MTNNELALTALCNEYCATLEGVRELQEPQPLVDDMLRLLPRIYIAARDLRPQVALSADEDSYLMPALDEDYYDAIRRNVETLLGPDDVYLEVFEEDMKYSDTPVSASVAEGLADLFQEFYNFLGTLRDATDAVQAQALTALADDFRSYWSQTLCNLLRALNSLSLKPES